RRRSAGFSPQTLSRSSCRSAGACLQRQNDNRVLRSFVMLLLLCCYLAVFAFHKRHERLKIDIGYTTRQIRQCSPCSALMPLVFRLFDTPSCRTIASNCVLHDTLTPLV